MGTKLYRIKDGVYFSVSNWIEHYKNTNKLYYVGNAIVQNEIYPLKILKTDSQYYRLIHPHFEVSRDAANMILTFVVNKRGLYVGDVVTGDQVIGNEFFLSNGKLYTRNYKGLLLIYDNGTWVEKVRV